MSRLPPTLEHIIDLIERQRAMLERQIAALRADPSSTEVVLLVRYLTLTSEKRVADWANENGFFLTGAKGQPRQYSHKDIAKLIASPPPATDPELIAMVKQLHYKNGAGADHTWN